jgi:hypothetical protein
MTASKRPRLLVASEAAKLTALKLTVSGRVSVWAANRIGGGVRGTLALAWDGGVEQSEECAVPPGIVVRELRVMVRHTTLLDV